MDMLTSVYVFLCKQRERRREMDLPVDILSDPLSQDDTYPGLPLQGS
jgi:hypothetical protein